MGKEKIQVSLHISEEMKDEILAYAKKEDRTLSGMIRVLIVKGLEYYNNKQN